MASRVLGELVVRIKGDSTDLNKTITQSQSKVEKFTQTLGTIGNRMSLAVTAPLTLLGGVILKSVGEMEQLQTSFEVMLGSADKAASLMRDLKNMAATTPFETTELANASKLLLQYGVAVEDLIPTMKMLGDISSGDSQKFQSLGLVMGQIRALGRLTGQDLRQMVSTGFNPLYVISEKTGESMASLTDKMSKGQISYDMVADAMKAATSEGGKFFQGMEKGSKTLTGLLSTLKDDAMEAGRSMLQFLLPTIKDAVKIFSQLFQALGNLDPEAKRVIVVVLGLAAAAGPTMKIIQGGIKTVQGLQKAFAAFSTFIKANPVFLIIAAGLAALVAASIAVGNAIKKAADPYKELVDAQRKNVDETNNLFDEYRKLSAESQKTEASQANLKITTDQLIQKYPELSKYVDEHTGTLRLNEEQIRNIQIAEEEKLKTTLEARKKDQTNLIQFLDARIKAYNSLDPAIKAFMGLSITTVRGEHWEKFKETAQTNLKEIDKSLKEVNTELDKLRNPERYQIEPSKSVKPVQDKTKELIKLEEEYAQKAFELSHDRLEILEREKQEALKKAREEKASKKTLDDIELIYERQKEEAITQIREDEAQKRDAIRAEEENKEALSAEFILGLQQKIASTTINQFGNVFSALGEALVTGEEGWKNFGKAAVGAVAAVIEAIGQEFLARAAAIAALSIIPPPIGLGPVGFGAAAGLAAAGAGALLAAGIVKGLASAISLGTGGIVMPQAGGVPAILAERGVPEVVIPDNGNVWRQVGDRIVQSMNRPINNSINNQINMPDNIRVNIGGKEFFGFLEQASRDGRFQIDPRRGISKRN